VPVLEGTITEADLERLERGYALYNEGDFDALAEFVSPDIVLERDGEQMARGWEAFRAFQEPDAFEWQKLDVVSTAINGDKVLMKVRVRSKGAASGIELDLPGWNVWTVKDGLGVHMFASFDEKRALEAFRAPA
jgi:ketosteroid isomerase-like protein